MATDKHLFLHMLLEQVDIDNWFHSFCPRIHILRLHTGSYKLEFIYQTFQHNSNLDHMDMSVCTIHPNEPNMWDLNMVSNTSILDLLLELVVLDKLNM